MKKQLSLLLLSSVALFAQAPNISYPAGTYTFDTGTPITPLIPTNSGGAVLTYGQVSTLTEVNFSSPSGVAVDTNGNVYVADTGNSKIRKITAAGVVTTIATSLGFISSPLGVAVDSGGNVFVANSGNNKIIKITTTGVSSVLAGGYSSATGVVVDSGGNVYVASPSDNIIWKIIPAGVAVVFAGSGSVGSADGTFRAASFKYPSGLAVDPVGNVYVADTGNNKIRKISPAAVVGSFLQSFYSPYGVAVDTGGNVYVADTGNNKIQKITLGVGITTLAGSGAEGSADGNGIEASFNSPRGVTVDSGGNVYVADTGNNKIRKITPAGVVTTLAGTGSRGSIDTGVAATFENPSDVAVDTGDNIYVADSVDHKIRKITSGGAIITLAGSGTIGSTDGTGASASFKYPSGLAVDPVGNVYVADTGNNKIRKITSAGAVTSLAGSGTIGSADGTGAAASFNSPNGVAVDAGGNVYVTDLGNNKIRKITPAGVVTTLAGGGTIGSADGTGTSASFYWPLGVVVEPGGNLYVSEIRNHKIRKITPAGVVTTFAGSGNTGTADGTGTTASFNSPTGMSIDSGGNVYVADRDNQKIRKITSVGVVTTLAGNGNTGTADGNGAVASFTSPSGVSVDSGGNVYVADAGNNRIRIITPGSYVINPTLVAGLNFDNTTGIISGTPTVSSATTNYTITAYNAAGSSSTTVTIATTTLGTTTFSKQDLKLYPNPVTSLLHIQTPNTINIDNVIISDLTGKKVLEQAQNTSQVDVAHLAKGVYIIEVFSGKEKFSSKFMKE